VAFAAASVEGRMQRGYGNVCLTDRACSDKLYSEQAGLGTKLVHANYANSIPGPGGGLPRSRSRSSSDSTNAQGWETAYRDLDDDARVPHLLIQLQDDLTRSRRREAAWISIIVHLLLIVFPRKD